MFFRVGVDPVEHGVGLEALLAKRKLINADMTLRQRMTMAESLSENADLADAITIIERALFCKQGTHIFPFRRHPRQHRKI